MRRERVAGLDVVLLGGNDRQGGGDGPLVVLLHGFGAGGESLVPVAWQLAGLAPAGTRFVCPAGPIELGLPFTDARAWWRLEVARPQRERVRGVVGAWVDETPPGLAEADARIAALLDEPELAAPACVLGGFSQGAMLVADLALRSARPLAGLMLFSGTLICAREWAPRFAARRGLPVLMTHGEADAELPYALAERLAGLWRDAGAEVTWVSSAGGHEIGPPALAAAGAFLRTRVG
jgi:phospholipase/carboxylesterase